MSEGERHSASHVVNMLWRLINAAYEGDSEEEGLSFNDKELLEDVLRFDSLTTIAKHRHVTPTTIANYLQRLLDRIEKKIASLSQASQMQAQARNEKDTKDIIISRNEQAIKRLKTEVEQLKAKMTEDETAELRKTITDLQHQLTAKKREVSDVKKELAKVNEEKRRLTIRFLNETSVIQPSTPKFMSDYQSKLLSSGIDVLRLREPVINHLIGEGITTVYDLVTIPRHRLSSFIPLIWRNHVQDCLERQNLSLCMSLTYRPEINKYEKKD